MSGFARTHHCSQLLYQTQVVNRAAIFAFWSAYASSKKWSPSSSAACPSSFSSWWLFFSSRARACSNSNFSATCYPLVGAASLIWVLRNLTEYYLACWLLEEQRVFTKAGGHLSWGCLSWGRRTRAYCPRRLMIQMLPYFFINYTAHTSISLTLHFNKST